LYVTPVQIAPGTFNLPISSPQEYSLDLSEQIGHYATLGIPEDTNALNDEVIDEDAFLMSCDSIMQERQKMFFYELERFQEGILACVFDTTDRVQHMFWRYMDNTHPMYDESAAEIYQDVIPRYYRLMDNILSKVQDGISSDTSLMVCSDHGFSSFKKSVRLNAWLLQNGFMALKDDKKSCEGLFDGVDWTKTKAYAIGFNSIFLNVQGRESEGIVTSEQISNLTEELAKKLTSLTDHGINVIEKISGAEKTNKSEIPINTPDLIAGYTKNYRCSWQTAIGGIADNNVIEENKKKWSGDHCCDATLVPGIFFSSETLSANNISVLEISKLAGNQI
jgi:predicted AlkP superfamily phosphohydrolase/phosphomutase